MARYIMNPDCWQRMLRYITIPDCYSLYLVGRRLSYPIPPCLRIDSTWLDSRGRQPRQRYLGGWSIIGGSTGIVRVVPASRSSSPLPSTICPPAPVPVFFADIVGWVSGPVRTREHAIAYRSRPTRNVAAERPARHASNAGGDTSERTDCGSHRAQSGKARWPTQCKSTRKLRSCPRTDTGSCRYVGARNRQVFEQRTNRLQNGTS